MGDEDESAASVDEVVDYCRIQAGLLSGSAETMGDEADELLDEIEEETAEIRARLEGRPEDVERTAAPPSADRPADGAVDVAAIEELERDLEEKQALVEAKQARMRAFQDLAAAYTDLAAELRSDAADGRAAMQRVVRFEADRDAPVYFDDRLTMYEAAAESRESDGE